LARDSDHARTPRRALFTPHTPVGSRARHRERPQRIPPFVRRHAPGIVTPETVKARSSITSPRRGDLPPKTGTGRNKGFRMFGRSPGSCESSPTGGHEDLTDEDAVEIARRIASESKWPWEGPISVTPRSTGIFGWGRVIDVRSNADHEDRNVVVSIDDRNGRMIRRAFQMADPEQLARAAFTSRYPDEPIAWTVVQADEGPRIVVGVLYGRTIPPRYMFFAVNRATDEVVPIEDETPYRPRVWR
jgi:hypothetical protein